MTGVRLTVVLDDAAALGAMARLRAMMADLTPVTTAIGVGLADNVRDRFEQGVDPAGNPWAPLLPAYASVKQGPGILRGPNASSSGLMASITSAAAGDQVVVGSNKVYAAVHQFGARIKPKNARALVFRLASGVVRVRGVTIPARPYLGISEADHETIEDVVEGFLARALRA